jgi:hypothetical protein
MTSTEELTKKKSHAPLSGVVESFTEIDIPDLGVGRVTTTATMILTTLLIEDGLMDRAEVLESVIEHLSIEPEDFERMRRNRKKHEALDYDNDEVYSWE